jgi:AAHS family 4-hydroxybenzoate transporter-like MFS transporter
MVGGFLLSLGWDLATVFSVAAIPAFLAGGAMLAKGGVRRAVPAAIPAAAE